GLIVSTGEEVPRGQSLRARMLIVELTKGDVDLGRLTACQGAARAGAYATALAGFVRWLAAHHEAICGTLSDQVQDLREAFAERLDTAAHLRMPRAIADIAAGWIAFLLFATDAGVLSREEADGFFRRAWEALLEAGAMQQA